MLSPYRSILFVPAHKPEWVEKALRADPDAVVLDLEDSVPDECKSTARDQLQRSIRHIRCMSSTIGVLVRTNGLSTRMTGWDLEAAITPGIDGLFVPKINNATDVIRYDSLVDYFEDRNDVTGVQYVIPIETVRAIQEVRQIAAVSPRVAALVGPTAEHADIAREVGFEWTPGGEETLYLRSRVLLACREAQLHPLTALWERIDDLGGLEEFARKGRALGFRGMVAIHPSHVHVLNEVFSMSSQERDYYRELVSTYEAAIESGAGAVRFRGLHIDRAHYEKALETLAESERCRGVQR